MSMVDITLCMADDCTKRRECHRYVTQSASDWQSYMKPESHKRDAQGHPLPFDGCDSFWPLERANP
jgi:hypothetical protein